MLGQIALSEHFTTVPWVLNYICFMHIVVQLIVANYGLTLKAKLYLKAKVAYNNMHRRILGYSRRDSASDMFASNAIDTFDALLHKNIYGFKRRIFNINNDMIRIMYNCFEIVNGPMWINWANSLYTVNL